MARHHYTPSQIDRMDEGDIQAELYLMSLDDERESRAVKAAVSKEKDDPRDAGSVKDGLRWYEELNARRYAQRDQP